MTLSKHILITGSTRGIGYALASSFLALGCSVTISGRTPQSVSAAVDKLSAAYPSASLNGLACDVTVSAQLQALWDQSHAHFGRIDVWINNAGGSGDEGMVWQRPVEEIQSVVASNILGVIVGSQVAVNGMLAQGFGAVYNVEGLGSDGRKHAGLTIYGTTKYAVHYFTQALALELKDTPLVVASLRPGMVITDMITDRYRNRPDDFARAKRIFNIIADLPETVAPVLAQKILANHKTGAILHYSSSWTLLWRFLTRPFVKRNLFA